MAHILIIDDEEILLDLISNTLRMEGYEVVALTDPLAVLQMQNPLPFDLLLTDIHTRPITGFELVKRLTAAGENLPVLFMSGYPAMNSAISAGLGERSLLAKPFTAQELRAAVKMALQRKTATVSHES